MGDDGHAVRSLTAAGQINSRPATDPDDVADAADYRRVQAELRIQPEKAEEQVERASRAPSSNGTKNSTLPATGFEPPIAKARR